MVSGDAVADSKLPLVKGAAETKPLMNSMSAILHPHNHALSCSSLCDLPSDPFSQLPLHYVPHRTGVTKGCQKNL